MKFISLNGSVLMNPYVKFSHFRDIKTSPSSFCRLDKWEEGLPVISNHHPHNVDIPITLHHQVFAHFQENCMNIHISMHDCNPIITLVVEMSKVFNCEDDRQ